jgi:hypothetical protein
VSRGGYVQDVGSVANTFEALGAGQELVTDAQIGIIYGHFGTGVSIAG